MKVQKIEDYDFGFVLDENNFRRLVDVCYEQLKKLPATEDKEIKSEFHISHGNGTIITKDNIEDVFLSKNINEFRIVGVLSHIYLDEDNSIFIQYIDLSHPGRISRLTSTNNMYSIHTSISSTDTDWSIITSSKLDDRIIQSKRKIISIPKIGFNNIVPYLFVGAIISAFITSYFYPSNPNFQKQKQNQSQTEDSLKQNSTYIITELEKIKKQNLNNIEALIAYERIKEESTYADSINADAPEFASENSPNSVDNTDQPKEDHRTKPMITFIAITLLIPLMVFFYRQIAMRVYPFYVFNFSDYKTIFQKLEDTRKFIINGIVVAFIISIISGIIVNLI